MKGKRIAAIAVAFAVIFSFLFSVTFPTAQADHVHESEENCAICATIGECNRLSRTLSTAVISSKVRMSPQTEYVSKRERKERTRSARRATPVSLKDKLSN